MLWSFVLRWTVFFKVLSSSKCRDLRQEKNYVVSASSSLNAKTERENLAMEPPKADACYVPQEKNRATVEI